MNTLIQALKEKLKILGYTDMIINSVIQKIDIALIENKLGDVEDYSKYIETYQYDEPTVEINKVFLNTNNKFIETAVIEGDIKTIAVENAFRTRFVAAEYLLSKRCALIGVSNDFKIKIYIYAPTQKMQIIYDGKTYEDMFKRDRDEVSLEYKEAFEKNKRLPTRKVEEILSMLVADFVIDEMVVENLNPRLKMYDDPTKFAENITTYSLRFINNKTNRIEIFEKEPNIRRLGTNVVAGIANNDPYIRISEMPEETNFLLNQTSYYWLKDNGKGQEEISIYTAINKEEIATYKEYKRERPEIKMIIADIEKQARKVAKTELDYSEYISEIIKSLNTELVMPSISVIKNSLDGMIETITPISYKYMFTTNPTEYEEKLYVSIEDNIGRNYKYKISETIIEDLTRIGNKLEYTAPEGDFVKRQSIADFNVNAPTAILKKETFIDESRLQDLLGYIYEDLTSYGTEKLPIPSITVEIYIPTTGVSQVSMYNGTSLDFTLDSMKGKNLFFNTEEKKSDYISGGEMLPGSTYVTVKYVNSKDEILKENKIGNLFPGTTFVPDILPIINDIEGKEWRAELTRIEPLVINKEPEKNIIKLKYIERYTRITFSFINREGKKIADDKQELIQVGENYNFESKKNIISRDNEEWALKFARPSKFIAKDDEEKNKVILVYDIDRADVVIKYICKETETEIAESKTSTVPANKKYSVEVPKYIVDSNGLGFNYIEGTETNIMVQKDTVNEVVLYYTEAKVPVTIKYKNENNISLMDDKVELIQIGKKYSYEFEDEITDFSCREWKLKGKTNTEITVDKNREKNIIEAVYEPILANVMVKFVNMDNRPIKGDKIEQAQIGEFFNSESLDEIIDNFGKTWKCVNKSDKIVVKSKEIENQVVLTYEPLMSKITIKYLDAEARELMESKYITLQVGTEYKDRPIEKFMSKDGKRWKIDYSKVESIVVKKYEEENIYSIYYDKETAKVQLTFFDAYNNELKETQEIESQIGAVVETKIFEKITDKSGGRWMIETTEPKNLIVKETNNFVKLIYGEMKAKVLVKSIDVKTQKPIIENILTSVKLGGIYMPNIQTKVLDKNKWRWKYIGEENISIVTKESEQENIIILNYEEDRSKVILKYANEKQEKIREDAVKEVQIGKEIKLDPTPKIADSSGLYWKYKSAKTENKIVQETDNLIYLTYEPLITDIKIKFVNENGESIVKEKIVKMQVGKEFTPEKIDRITDNSGKVWIYNKISDEKIRVREEKNEIIMTFEKLMKNISIQLVDEEANLIAKPTIFSRQVGEEYEISYEKGYVDKEEKAWLLVRADKDVIVTNEDEEKNIVKIWYEKELVDLKLTYYNISSEEIKPYSIQKVQIGSIYNPTPEKEIIDEKTKLGWKLPENFKMEYKVDRNPEKNVLKISYEKLEVDIFIRYKDTKENEIIEKTVQRGQVGTSYTPKVEQVIIDAQDREWLYGAVEETKLFAGVRNKIPTITIARDENKNEIDLIYRPSLATVIIRCQETLGNLIKPEKQVEAQIGSIYEAEIIETLQDEKKIKWVYNPNSKSTLKVGHEESENIIILAYEEEKALVTYKYQDEYGNRLRSPKRKLVQIGSMHKPEIENVVEDYQGKMWEYKAKSIDVLEIKDDESSNIIEVIYKPLKVDTVLHFVNAHGKQITKEVVVKAQLGSEYTPEIQDKITDDDSKLFKFVKCEPETIKIQEIPIGAIQSPNTFELTYEPVFSDVTITYKTIDGEKIKDEEVSQMQVGLIYDPPIAQFVKDENGIQWELISKDVDSIRVKEDSRENVISMVYEVAKTEVIIKYMDVMDNSILESTIITMEVGKEFVPEIQNEIIDDNGKKWVFTMVNPVKLTVGSINNIIKVTYQEKKAQVIVRYQTKDGKTLKEDFRSKIQVGTRYEPKNNTRVIYEGAEVWRFACNEPSSIVVSENVSENIITQVYTKEEINEEKKEQGTYYNPEIEKFIDKELVEEAKIEEEKAKETEKIESVASIEFKDENLKVLERNIALTNEEKTAIDKLNKYNATIISKLNEAINQNTVPDYDALETEINNEIIEEKKTVQNELKTLIDGDRSGGKLLKIFEAIVASEINDKNFNLIQQRKAISIADYFTNKQVSEMEQANYICEKGIVEKAIECANEKMSANPEEYKKIKVMLIYEKLMLNNYSKARSVVKDDYFKNQESKGLVSPEVVVIVANNMPKQAYKLLLKIKTLSTKKENELEAILKLLNTQQLGTLMTMVEKIDDGKTKKLAKKKIKEIVG